LRIFYEDLLELLVDDRPTNMGFNGIQGSLNQVGQIPWEYVVGYFVIALAVAFFLGRKTGGLSSFTTLDFVYIGIGVAFAVVWQWFIGAFLGGFLPGSVSTYIDIGYIGGQLITMFVIAALVRKVGVGITSFVVYSFLSDIFHYGFGGEPMYFIYEGLTYGLFLDLTIAATGGNIFGVKSSMKASAEATATTGGGGSSGKLVAIMIIEGAIVGALFQFPDPIIYSGFFSPFINGGKVDWQTIYATIGRYLISGVPAGAIGGIIANRVARAIGQ
jgi:hypothetical protein